MRGKRDQGGHARRTIEAVSRTRFYGINPRTERSFFTEAVLRGEGRLIKRLFLILFDGRGGRGGRGRGLVLLLEHVGVSNGRACARLVIKR